ncbi:hypothetical protein J1TS3_44900 [Siminovitchia fordii]|uniref:Uncharacterized protein n=1 Tax=Siminovitchia fordii TaxID=254759 RepID=A0ABQ4KCA4_9BACI|nr:hypothetical protein J1TS3_44900 [Siminovitchia fordii]
MNVGKGIGLAFSCQSGFGIERRDWPNGKNAFTICLSFLHLKLRGLIFYETTQSN